MTTIFSKIIEGSIPSSKVYEDDLVLIIHDIQPLAPIHWLIIPKIEVKCIQDLQPVEFSYLTAMIQAVQKATIEHKIKDYRLVINNGENAGQTIFHLHMHLLAGRDAKNHSF